MENGNRKTKTTTTRRTLTKSASVDEDTDRLNMRRVKSGGNEEMKAKVSPKQHRLGSRKSWSCNTNTNTCISNNTAPVIATEKCTLQGLEEHQQQSCCISESDCEGNNVRSNQENSRSELLKTDLREVDSSSDSPDQSTSNATADTANKIQENAVDSDEIKQGAEEKAEQDETVSANNLVDVSGTTEEDSQLLSPTQKIVDHAIEAEDGCQKNKLVDHNDDKDEKKCDNGLIEFDNSKKNYKINNAKSLLNSVTEPSNSAATSTSASAAKARCKPLPSRSIHKSTLNSPTPSTTGQKASNENEKYTTPETHSKLQALVDLVMWRDISKSTFIFGFGTFIIISSSYAKDFNFSLISAASYLSLVYLAIVFLYKSFISRGVVNREDWPDYYVWGEEEAIWFVKLTLPYLNEFLLQLRGIFSGDPATTLKLAAVLFVLARCGNSITVWKMLKLGFFGVFIIPKLCSSYSPQITAYARFWGGRFQDAWQSCSHKKALAFAVFIVIWNFCSTVARAWAAFMLFVAFRYYQQSLITNDFVEVEEQTGSHNSAQIQRHLARQRCRIPTSLDQKKQKKSI